MGGDKKRIVSTWNLETPESLFRLNFEIIDDEVKHLLAQS